MSLPEYNIFEWEEAKLSYEKKDYYVDWTLQLQEGESLSGQPTAQAQSTGIVLSELETTGNLTRVWLAGGTLNRSKVAFKAVTSTGRILGVIGVLRIADVGAGPSA